MRRFLVRYIRHSDRGDAWDYIETEENLSEDWAKQSGQPGVRWIDLKTGVAIDFDTVGGVYPVADINEARTIASRFSGASIRQRGVEITE